MRSHDGFLINIRLDWRVLALGAALVVIGAVTFVTAGAQGVQNPNGEPETVGLPDRAEKAATAASSTSDATQGFVTLRSFYLTDDNHDADEATSVCAPGYHMASLWEILDVSNIAYAYDHPDTHTKADSGQGPPAQWYGWVRTGHGDSTADSPGIGNCQAWTSSASADRGTIARLTYDWEGTGTAVGPWETSTFVCSGVAPVWCVQDAARIRQVFVPDAVGQ